MEGKRLIYGGIAAFVITCMALFAVGGRLAPETPEEPGFAIAETARPAADGTFQVTLDTTDNNRWVHFDLAAGRARGEQGEKPPDLSIRRYVLRAPMGAIDLGKVPLESARVPPGAVFAEDEKTRGEVQSPAMANWYSYSYWSHRLRSHGHTYAVRLAGGGVAYLNLVSYYCEPEGAGCLTMRYRLELDQAR